MSLIATVLWPGLRSLEPTSQLGGILARKPGYHNSRDHLPSDDYSVAQFSVDRQGPADESAAIDWTFPEAQSGNYTRIMKYSKRLLAAGRAGDADPRTVYMREFFGNADLDNEVEGWDFSKNRSSSSDSSHLWHIHISIHRKYVNDPKAMAAILSLLKGEAPKLDVNVRPVTWEKFTGSLPGLIMGDSDPIYGPPSGASYVSRVQKQLGVTADGDYGPMTQGRVLALGTGSNGHHVALPEYIKLYAMWTATPISSRVEKGRTRDVTRFLFNGSLPILKAGDDDSMGGITGGSVSYVARAQRNLGVESDGDYGPLTVAAVKALGFGDGKTINLEVYAGLYGLWGFVRV